ncbi:act minimal PKS acyl carrier protein [Amycolatopsis sulphurea]|uniref:Act minimal PKS acyl carrier protein n=1 Tax=Amycolatopsis sulphurea TaxID=76022 RepID=V9XWG7_9PSEU|nr:acyl carrier protein [Amycolatopsis sulphurea]AHD25928.1 putative acyl carrier protein [Amycolatopsis sulphurea]PFG50035.1 act minimal PKS acyl carrier protein [Amycolatopsis sulphurea]
MAEFTIAELVRLLRECAGEEEGVDLDGEVGDLPFDELGYDSLALFNTIGRIEREYTVDLPEDVVWQATTPGALVDLVNSSRTSPAAAD